MSLRFRQTANLPLQRQLDGNIIDPMKWEFEINRMDAIGVVEDMFLAGAEQAHGNEHAVSCSGSPSRDLEMKFRDQGIRRTLPVGRVGQLDVNSSRNVLFDLILEKFLALGLVSIALLDTAPHGFQPCEG